MQTEGYISTPGFPKDYTSLGYTTHKESDFKIYNPLLQKKKYFAPSVLYHMYKNIDSIKDAPEFIGFLEYDFKFQFSCKDFKKLHLSFPKGRPCELIEKSLQKGVITVLSLRWRLQELNAQKQITVNGKHWLDFFLEEYNKFYSRNISKEDILRFNIIVPTQQSFITDVESFRKIMEFPVYLIDNSLLEKCYPAPATILERYIGLCISFSRLSIRPLLLTHQGHHGYIL